MSEFESNKVHPSFVPPPAKPITKDDFDELARWMHEADYCVHCGRMVGVAADCNCKELPDISGQFVKDYNMEEQRAINLSETMNRHWFAMQGRADMARMLNEERLRYWRSLPWWKRMWRKRP